MKYEVYKIQNKLSNKIYVGITNAGYKNRFRKHLSEARNGSSFILHNAIRKYGAKEFFVVLLEECDSVESLKERETYWINTLDTMNREKGYNMTAGGDGTFGRECSEETRLKLSKAKEGKKGNARLNVKITNLNSEKTFSFESFEDASKFFNKSNTYITYLRKKNNCDCFFFKEYKIEITKPEPKQRVRDTTQDIPTHMAMMQEKSRIARQENKKEYSEAQKIAKRDKTKIVQQLDLEGNLIDEHFGAREAARKLKVGRSGIQHCLKGRNKSAHNYIWKYKE